MKIAIASLLLLLLPVLAHAQSKPQIAVAIGSSLDAASTVYVLKTTPRAYETNPIMGSNVGSFVAFKAAGTAAFVWWIGKIEPKHPKLAKALGYGSGAFFSGLAARNLRMKAQMR